MQMYYCRPDGKKKAYVRLTSDHDALDVANKVRENIVVLAIDDDQHWWWADWVYLVSWVVASITISHAVLELILYGARDVPSMRYDVRSS